MNINPQAACRDIDAELARKGAAHLSPVRILAVHDISAGSVRPRLIIHPARRRHPVALDVEVDRERLPPGIVEEFVRRLLIPADEQAAFDGETDALMALLKPLTAIIPKVPLVAQDVGSSLGWERHWILHETLDARLERSAQMALRVSARDTGVIQAIVEKEMRLAAKLGDAGSRIAALTCCPVTASAITTDPNTWRDNLERALNGGYAGIAFRDGNYQPNIRLGDGVRWKGCSLDMEQDLPDQARLAAVGRPLRDLVGHRLLPGHIIVTDVFRRANGLTTVRTDAKPVPLAPLMDLLGVQPEH